MSSDTDNTREFVGLIVSHQPNLRAYIISLIPGVPGTADVLQETNLVLWQKMKSFKPGTNFTAWAFAVARFEVKAHCRKLHRQSAMLADEKLAEELAAQISTEFDSGLDAIEARIQALQFCMQKLNENERELIRQRYGEKSTLAEYARQTGSSNSSLRTTLQRLRIGLRKCISERLAIAPMTP